MIVYAMLPVATFWGQGQGHAKNISISFIYIAQMAKVWTVCMLPEGECKTRYVQTFLKRILVI